METLPGVHLVDVDNVVMLGPGGSNSVNVGLPVDGGTVTVIDAGPPAAGARNRTLEDKGAHGGKDRITSPAASREFAGRVKGDCTFRPWEGYYHELHNEPQYGEFYDFLLRWLKERLDGGP